MKKFNYLLLSLFLIGFSSITNSQSWEQVGSDIQGKEEGDKSGEAISLSDDGNVVAIGSMYNDDNGTSAGQVRIFRNVNGNFTQIGEDINGDDAGDWFGGSLSLSADGSVVAIGASEHDITNKDYIGQVKIFENVGDSWVQIGEDIYGENMNDHSGKAVSLSKDGNVVAIGAPDNDAAGSSSGNVRVFKNFGGTWTQIGENIDGEAETDWFGSSVSLNEDGTILAVGAPLNDENGSASGNVRIFKLDNDSWTQIGNSIPGEAESDESGRRISLSADGNILAIASHRYNGDHPHMGQVRVFKNDDDNWAQIGDAIIGKTTGEFSGYSVNLSSNGNVVAIGAYYNSDNGDHAGQARIFQNQNDQWVQLGQDINGEATGDFCGWSVSLNTDGTVVAVGARDNDGNGDNAGNVRVFKLNTDGIETDLSTTVSIYPNPGDGLFNIIFDNQEAKKITVSDISGKTVFIKESVNENVQIDLTDFNSGYYILKIETDKGITTSKIIKR